ncbi:ribonuclease H-like domain-containing protein [Sporosalibacterium faouarense]|uniref:ribonuclease H-like domain-containing protein n=1 Tax=Sporosalibacterium faouarense TaxID=516123 RepID=UPI00192AD9D1|nr:ribonuclease H-like domain-containing protein [Sporosalibacterium faouarense]
MDIIKHKLDENIYYPDKFLDLISNKEVLFFDIETTGFNRTKNSIVLIGMLYAQGTSIIIEQYFAESLNDEFQLLQAFKNLISKFDVLVSFNGDTFDIPFLNSKYKTHNIDFSIDRDNSFDILKLVRKNKNILGLENCKLKTLEKRLGFNRKDEISGKDSIKIYKSYLKTQNKIYKDIVLQHNFDDIYYLPKTLQIYDLITDITSLNFNLLNHNDGLNIFIDLSNLSIDSEMLCVQGSISPMNFSEQVHYDENYTFKWIPDAGSFKFDIQIHHGYLSNGNECYYLNKDDFRISIDLIDKTIYTVPNNLIIVKDNNNLIYNNIKGLLYETISHIFKNII